MLFIEGKQHFGFFTVCHRVINDRGYCCAKSIASEVVYLQMHIYYFLNQLI